MNYELFSIHPDEHVAEQAYDGGIGQGKEGGEHGGVAEEVDDAHLVVYNLLICDFTARR